MTSNSKNHYITKTGMTIDPSHAYFNIFGADKVFNTIKVRSYQPLQEALLQGVVEPETKLMIFEVGESVISIPLQQIAFHHVAQGERENQAWVAFFCGACNMGTAANPIIDGKVYHFRGTGVYHGMAIFRDTETGSFWEHATGECIHGELQGTCLETIPAKFLLAEQVLENDPGALITFAKQSWIKRLLSDQMLRPMLTPEGHMPAPFRLSMGEQDTRLPELQLGLGVWINGQARFYSMDTLKTHGNALIDRLNQENLLIYIDPIAQIPIAYRCDASSFAWDGDTIILNTGERIRNGYIQASSSDKRKIDTPDQQFVRWYAFSFKFPNCDIFDYQG